MDDERDNGLYYSQCFGKHPYKSRSEAEIALTTIQRRGRFKKRKKRNGKVEIYPCRFCQGFHHGSNKRHRRTTRSSQRIYLGD